MSSPGIRILRHICAGFFILAGANHFVSPVFYEQIIPPGFPNPKLLVVISGIAEIAGGAGLLAPRLRRVAGWGLIALLIAVFPANVYMAVYPERIEGLTLPTPLLWARLPLQGVLGWWVWRVAMHVTDT